jgi:phosphate starvation-inducible PhoH-like protein
LKGVTGISFISFDERDVVRHNLVQRIVKAYERYNEAVVAGRQLVLRLGDGGSEATSETVAEPKSNGAQEGPAPEMPHA